MINLLPTEDQISNKKEYGYHLNITRGLFLLVLLIIAFSLLWLVFIFSSAQEETVMRRLDIVNERLTLQGADHVYLELEILNQKINLFNSNKGKTKNISLFVKQIVKEKPSLVQVSSISYKEGKNSSFIVQGKAVNRPAFLIFKKNLGGNNLIKKVISPVGNLLKEKDLKFTLTIEL